MPRGVEKDPVLFNETTRIHEFVAGPYLTGEMVRASLEGSPDALVIRGTGLGHLRSMTPWRLSGEHASSRGSRLGGKDRDSHHHNGRNGAGEVNMDVYSKGRDQRAMGLFGHGSCVPRLCHGEVAPPTEQGIGLSRHRGGLAYGSGW